MTNINIQSLPVATRDLLLSYLVKVENCPYCLIKNELRVAIDSTDFKLMITRYSEFLKNLRNVQIQGLSHEDFNTSTK